MAQLGIPKELKIAAAPAIEPAAEEKMLHMSEAEFDSRIQQAREHALREGEKKGRDLQLQEDTDEVATLRRSLEEQQQTINELAAKLESTIGEVADIGRTLPDKIGEVLELVSMTASTELLLEAKRSPELIENILDGIREQFDATDFVIEVSPDVIETMSDGFSAKEHVTVTAGDEGTSLSIRFRTDAGTYEYELDQVFDKLRETLDRIRPEGA